MANYIYGAIALTGGGTGALDKIDGQNLQDKDAAVVFLNPYYYLYLLDADSGLSESSPEIIAPDTNAGSKRWILAAARASDSNTDTSSFNGLFDSNDDDVQKCLDQVDNLFTSGSLLKHEFGGLELNVSASDGIPKISGGSTSILTAPNGDLVGTTATQTLSNKIVVPKLSIKTGTYTINVNDEVILGNTTSSSFTLTLFAATSVRKIKIGKTVDANILTVAANGSDTIEGNSSITLTNRYDTIVLYSDGISTWYQF